MESGWTVKLVYKGDKMDKIQTVNKSLQAPRSLVVRNCGTGTDSSYRTDFMRDRDRILYSKAFRRLSGKTQVYITGSDDHLRTRLTHTLEVSQIARTIAQTLKLDTDLTEAISLGHDIGHTPFGHAGERMLHQLMTEDVLPLRLFFPNRLTKPYLFDPTLLLAKFQHTR